MSQFIADFRQKNPQYDDMADDQLVTALHGKYYSDIPIEAFNQQIGFQVAPIDPVVSDPVAEQEPGLIAQPRPQDPVEPMTGYGASSDIPIQQQEPIPQQQPVDGFTGAAMKAPEEQGMLELVGSKLSEIGGGIVSGVEGAIPQAKLQVAGMLQQGEVMTPEQFEKEKDSLGMRMFKGDYDNYVNFASANKPLSTWLADKGKEISQGNQGGNEAE